MTSGLNFSVGTNLPPSRALGIIASMRYASLLVAPLLAGCIVHETIEYVPPRQPVTVERALTLLRSGVHDSVVRADLRANGMLRPPAADEIVALKRAGASDELLQEMIAAPPTAPRPGEVIRCVMYDTRPAEGALMVGLGAAAAWALFGHHHDWHYHWHYRGCGHW